ncbi:MAG: cytochrome c3 family protein [Pseudomonadota bacterium]|nr:cytochrome c3 family protein [Pseudomonadota bacterium]
MKAHKGPFRLALLLLLIVSFIIGTGISKKSLAKQADTEEICLECISVGQCLECHDEIDSGTFAASAHGANACTSCHSDIWDLDKHADCEVPMQPVNCGFCHQDEAREYAQSVHVNNDVNCTDCHANIHELISIKDEKAKSVQMCSGCHDNADYMRSVHGKGLVAGNPDSPSCADCHGLHNIIELEVDDQKSAGALEAREFNTSSCKQCHDNDEMMERNKLSTHSFKSYRQEYHGKVEKLGGAVAVAGCADCHTAHKQLPRNNPESSLSAENLVTTCGKCHTKANANFIKYEPHATHHDRENFPLLYWTFITMTSLLCGVFAIFWLHTILWLIRSYIEKNKLRRQGIFHESHAPKVFYKRFTLLEKFLHFLMMTSFLGLVLTGLPLKFVEAPWAIGLAQLVGGPQMAGLIHRWCAALTFTYFIITIVWSAYFLIIKPTGENFFQKLFGPDSLFPNFKDGRDIAGMCKWFFGAGEMPKFDRWTYWDKFDFLAVFWGMFAIGFTGLMLWMPEFFAQFLPGWAFNVAIIVHSDEALLASVFIFTVHFFNAHIRPEKFPMDQVIFTGVVSGHEMEEERPEQFKRLKEKGELEKHEAKYPGVLSEAIGQLIGITGVAIGMLCLFLIAWGFLG